MSGMKKWAVIAAAVATMCTGSMAFAWGGASSDKGTSSGKMDQSSQGLSDKGTAPDKKQPSFDQNRSPEQSKQQTQPGSSGMSQD